MSRGTDLVILGIDIPLTVSTKGRPKINRDLAKRLFLVGFKPSQVAGKLGCHVKTAQRIRRKLEKKESWIKGLERNL